MRHQFILVKWLGQVIVSAETETLYLVLDTRKSGRD
jgi:hypothetical protein